MNFTNVVMSYKISCFLDRLCSTLEFLPSVGKKCLCRQSKFSFTTTIQCLRVNKQFFLAISLFISPHREGSFEVTFLMCADKIFANLFFN